MASSSSTPPPAISGDSKLFVVVDIGGTKIASALATQSGSDLPSVSGKSEIPTPAQAGSKAVVDAVFESVRRCLALTNQTPDAIGIASAGVVNTETGAITSATDLIIGWAGTPLGELVEREFGLPVAVLNDVHAHALGEWTYGAGKGFDSMLAVAVGTGIGGAIIAGGKLHLAHTSRPVTSDTCHIRSPRICVFVRRQRTHRIRRVRHRMVTLYNAKKDEGAARCSPARNHGTRGGWRKLCCADPFRIWCGLGDSIAGIANCVDPQAVGFQVR